MAIVANEEKGTVTNDEITSLLDLAGGEDSVLTPSKEQNNVFTNTVLKDEKKLGDILNPEALKKLEEEKKKEEELAKKTAEDAVLKAEADKKAAKELDDLNLTVGGFPENTGDLEGETSEEKEVRVAEEKAAKADKNVTLKAIEALIKKGVLLPFEDEKPLAEYTDKDTEELLQENFNRYKEENKEEVTKEFFDMISSDLQYLAKYEIDGGKNIKAELKRLSSVVDIRTLDPMKEADQDEIIKLWLTETSFGTEEEISQEVLDIRDRKRSEEKAKQFHPKLEAKASEGLTREAGKQEDLKNKRIEATKKYSENVYNILVKGEVGGIKVGKKVQDMIYTGLTESQYASLTGRTTTKLGHLLEKYQVVEPNYEKMAKVMWLLEDEEGFEAALKNKGAAANTEETVRKLKRAESEKGSGGNSGSEVSDTAGKDGEKKNALKRNNKSIFARE